MDFIEKLGLPISDYREILAILKKYKPPSSGHSKSDIQAVAAALTGEDLMALTRILKKNGVTRKKIAEALPFTINRKAKIKAVSQVIEEVSLLSQYSLLVDSLETPELNNEMLNLHNACAEFIRSYNKITLLNDKES